MRALLDVNLLLALHDRRHVHNKRAETWWKPEKASGWASCPITENAFLRISTQPSYPSRFPMLSARAKLLSTIANTDHLFWPDDVSLLDLNAVDPANILGPNQLTDTYLLALAVRHGGRLVTFDRSVNTNAVRNFKPEHLVVL